MSIIHLTSQDFYIDKKKSIQPTNDLVLCVKKDGLFFVMFHADKNICKFCDEIMPFFVQLPRMFPMCSFGLININKNINLAIESKKTITNITHVPYFLFFVNGRPAMRYDGQRNPNEIIKFLTNMVNMNKPTNQFVSQNNQQPRQQQQNDEIKSDYEIPAYSVGIPFNVVCDDELCYIKYEDAYKQMN